MKRFLLATALMLLVTNCATKEPDVVSQIPSAGYKSEIDEYRRQEAIRSKPNPSLWSDVGSQGTIFLDYKARRIGDVVIVKIVESSSASNSSANNTNKTANYNSGITAMLGLPANLGVNDFLGSGSALNPTIGATTANSHSGTGTTTKSDKVTATIASRIVDIMPSGNLVIEGNREIVIDREKQTITLRGIIRQKDIDATNNVLSSAIADAQITYSGNGAITQATKKGWLGSFIDVIWPF